MTTVTGCHAQQEKTSGAALSDSKTNIPIEHHKVNRVYDDKGNLVRYDSTSSWSYSGSVNAADNSDSLWRYFNGSADIFKFFNTDPGSITEPDSVFFGDLVHGSEFMKIPEHMFGDLDKVMEHMDKVQQDILKHMYRKHEGKYSTTLD